jgi:hypothetical protein
MLGAIFRGCGGTGGRGGGGGEAVVETAELGFVQG